MSDKTLAFVAGYWSTNIGNSFFQLGAQYVLRESFPYAKSALVADQPGYYNVNRGNPRNAFIPVEHMSIDYLAILGPFLRPECRGIWGETIEELGINAPYILCVSSVYRYKNLLSLVNAYAKLREQNQVRHILVLVGALFDKEYLGDIMRTIKQHGIEEWVLVLGKVPHQILPSLYRGAALYVYPSLCEVFGLTLIEAMACGTPVVTSSASVMPEICGDAALYFDPTDPGDIAQMLSKGLGDESLREELRQRGLSQAEKFDWTVTAAQTLFTLEKAG